MINTKKHQDNLTFIINSLKNKPETTELFRNIIEFNSKNLQVAKVVFPTVQINPDEFYEEHKKTSISSLFESENDLVEYIRHVNR